MFVFYSEGGMEIKWVDNTHALGIFSCASAGGCYLSVTLNGYKCNGVVVTSDLLVLLKDFSPTCAVSSLQLNQQQRFVNQLLMMCVALQALSIRHPLLKTRMLSKASKKAKAKAARCAGKPRG